MAETASAGAPLLWVMGFDLEAAGRGYQHHIMGMGAVLMNAAGQVLAIYKGRWHHPKGTTWEAACWIEFWSKLPAAIREALTSPLVGGGEGPDADQCELFGFREWMAFRLHWEAEARAAGAAITYVTDNAVFDAARLSGLIAKHRVADLDPLPYSADGKDYMPVKDVGDMLAGAALSVPGYRPGGPVSKKAALQLADYQLPAVRAAGVSHDHLPWNDAFTIAGDYLALLNRFGLLARG